MFGVPIVFILHNPSLAGRDMEDPTSRRCIDFSKRLGGSDTVMVNAATGVATDAKDLARLADPIGRMADEAIAAGAEFARRGGGIIIAAWGCPKGTAPVRRLLAERFRQIRSMGLPLLALSVTAEGHPEHPLYLRKDLVPRPLD